MKRLAIALIVVTLIPVSALAQRGQGGTRTRGGRAAAAVVWNGRSTLLLFRALLELTDQQSQQLTAAFDVAAEAAVPIATALDAGKNALFDAVKAGQDDDELERLAQRHGELTIQLQALQARTFARMWALLSDDQKAKVDESTYAHIGTFLANTARFGGS